MRRRKFIAIGLVICLVILAGLIVIFTPPSKASTFQATAPSTVKPDIPLTMSEGMTNNDWKPIIREFDGVEMVLVPSGCFMMGIENGIGNDGPPHQQCIDEPFWLDRYEVTNLLFGSSAIWTSPFQPRDSVTWYEAQAHCETRMAYLPTEIQWEYAARGVDGWLYPWGNNYIDENVTSNQNSIDPLVVGSHPNGESWVGALDMSGNLTEWTSSAYMDYPYKPQENLEVERNNDTYFVIKGGSFAEANLDYLKSTSRYMDLPTHQHVNFGFRCAHNYD